MPVPPGSSRGPLGWWTPSWNGSRFPDAVEIEDRGIEIERQRDAARRPVPPRATNHPSPDLRLDLIEEEDDGARRALGPGHEVDPEPRRAVYVVDGRIDGGRSGSGNLSARS